MAGGLFDALTDLAGALVPLEARGVARELEERLSRIPNRLNEYGFDPYGLDPEWIRRGALPAALLYRYYFRIAAR